MKSALWVTLSDIQEIKEEELEKRSSELLIVTYGFVKPCGVVHTLGTRSQKNAFLITIPIKDVTTPHFCFFRIAYTFNSLNPINGKVEPMFILAVILQRVESAFVSASV